MVDDKDRLILFEMLQDCTQPLTKIAKAVKLPQQTVSYRIKKLEADRVIKKYTLNINYQKLGFNRHSLYLDLKEFDPKSVDNYVKSVTDIKEVSCCYMLHGVSQWKLYISVWTKTIERYDEIQTKIISKFKKHINTYISFQSVKSYTYLARRLNLKKKSKVDIKETSENIPIKDIDWKIMTILKKDSTTPIIKVAKECNTTVNTVMARLKFLKDNEIIERFYPILDMKKLGYNEYTYISRIDPSYHKEIENFINYAKNDPRFVIIIKAVGYVNLYYAFLAENHNELLEINAKIEKMLGKAVLQTYKIEVEDMIS